MPGPLAGVKVVQLAGLGPVPFAATVLSDMGASVVRIDRPGWRPLHGWDILARGRRKLTLDLKRADEREQLLELCREADIVLEGFRPRVLERLALGPQVLLDVNPRLVIGRMTGWGQTGPLADAPGHDINYIGLTGALAAIGPAGGAPVPPLNLIGDYGGGAMYLVAGTLAALHESRRSGRGQVVDCAMIDGVAALMAEIVDLANIGRWRDARGSNLLDGGAHFYGVYGCADGAYVAVAPMEPQFYAEFLARMGIDEPSIAEYESPTTWPAAKERLAAIFAARTRDEWCAAFDGTQCCVTPVLSIGEAAEHPHMRRRAVYVDYDGVRQPAPAPRFSCTPAMIQSPPPLLDTPVTEILQAWRGDTP